MPEETGIGNNSKKTGGILRASSSSAIQGIKVKKLLTADDPLPEVSERPYCKDGEKCLRTDPEHWVRYQHTRPIENEEIHKKQIENEQEGANARKRMSTQWSASQQKNSQKSLSFPFLNGGKRIEEVLKTQELKIEELENRERMYLYEIEQLKFALEREITEKEDIKKKLDTYIKNSRGSLQILQTIPTRPLPTVQPNVQRGYSIKYAENSTLQHLRRSKSTGLPVTSSVRRQLVHTESESDISTEESSDESDSSTEETDDELSDQGGELSEAGTSDLSDDDVEEMLARFREVAAMGPPPSPPHGPDEEVNLADFLETKGLDNHSSTSIMHTFFAGANKIN
eukprot:TRINITY_DN1734_c0_g1_i1.p1 TRINITY_DN1734_c0_g1~~TRINITY_DN1734_c0_g1_i1.p1  ORF type:complete len:341 (-),score=74.50 TRINITY_DN1734_c0_g1_i1:30-1052(-)